MDAKKIAQLLDLYAAPLELYASQWCACPEDCVQEAFIELAARASGPDKPVAWLFRVVKNRALNARRSVARRADYEREVPLSSPVDPAELVESQDDQLRLRKLISSLPPLEQEILLLRVWGELTWEQIAKSVNTSSSSAQRQYVKVLEKLKQSLDSPCLTKLMD